MKSLLDKHPFIILFLKRIFALYQIRVNLKKIESLNCVIQGNTEDGNKMKFDHKETRLERQIHSCFDFLQDEFEFDFRKNEYPEYLGFPGPIYVFSYYNAHGCLSFHYVEQKDELGLYISDRYSSNQYQLTEHEVPTSDICNHKVYTKRRLLIDISAKLRIEAETKRTVLGIKI